MLTACNEGCWSIIINLLNKGQSPNVEDKLGNSLIFLACKNENASFDVVKLIIEKGFFKNKTVFNTF